MYLIMRLLNRFVTAEEGALRFTALDFSGDNVIVAGRVIYLKDIRSFIETLAAEIKEHIRTKLFFGLDAIDIEWSPGVVHEEPRNICIGHSCFHDPRNGFARHKDSLLRLILTHPQVRGHFHYIDQQGQIVWKAGPCFAYMHACHETEMMLFAGTQTSVGETGRATELASHLVENVPGGSIRNILVMFQYFCMMGTYNKASYAIERDVNMIRVPYPEIGRLWMLYHTFIRPLLVVWQKYFHGQKAAVRARQRLFFGPHRPVSPSELSRNLSYHTYRLLGVKMSISLWRHVVTWFLNYHLAHCPDHSALSTRSALAFQMGHNDGTHSLYAVDARLPAKIDFHVFFQTMRASGIWHDLVGLKSDLLRNMSRPSTRAEAVLEQSNSHADNALVTTHLSSASIAAIAAQVRKELVPEIVRVIVQTRANDLASLLDAVGLHIQSPLSPPIQEPVTHLLHPSRLHDLRKFLADDNAAFRHTQQALATELIAGKNPSILLIGPTGTSFNALFVSRVEQYCRVRENTSAFPQYWFL
jgi:hypothetical protein